MRHVGDESHRNVGGDEVTTDGGNGDGINEGEEKRSFLVDTMHARKNASNMV